MKDIGQPIEVVLNNKSYPVRIFEDYSLTSKFLKDIVGKRHDRSPEESLFEEEYVGPSMEGYGGNVKSTDGHNGNDSSSDDMMAMSGSMAQSMGPLDTCINPYVPSYNMDSPPPPLIIDPTQPISEDLNDRIKDIPDLNDSLSQNYSKTHEDLDLDELLSSFQRLTDNPNKEPQSIKVRKKKQKKKKLVGISLNCNGLGCANKKSWINNLINSEAPVLFGVQETKLGLMDDCTIRSMWPRSFVDYAFSSSMGASDTSLKEHLWSSIDNIVNESGITWILFGDFNAVRHSGERAGSTFDARETSLFNDFIARNGLFNFPLNGRRFTRFDSGGFKASKLDRFVTFRIF
ncbi:cysteine-rich receptor-like protein kinase, partial [Tanacetum coccineum]